MRYLLVFILIISSVIFHSTVQPELSQKLILGDMPTLLTLVTGLFMGPASGAAIGFATGLLIDLSLSSVVGVGVLTYTMTGYLAGIMEQNLHAEERTHLSIMIIGLTLTKFFLNGFFMVLAGLGVQALPYLGTAIAPSLVNGLMFFILFGPISRLAAEKLGRA